MIHVQFPAPQFRIRKKAEKQYIFDAIRKRWLLLTGEEWVRQNVVAYLVQTMVYPKEAIALEKGLTLNGLKKRFDILVYNKDHQPWMLVECKEPKVPLGEEVLLQVLRYNISLPVRWLVITNGQATMAWEVKDRELVRVINLPAWCA